MSSRQQRQRIQLSLRIQKFGKMVRPYSRCQQSNSECKLLMGSSKCGNCTRRGLRCDIRDVEADDFVRIDREATRLENEIEKMEQIRRENDARLERFRRLRKALHERELEMVRRGVENIEELERIEDEERTARGSSEVSFDPVTALEQFSSETPAD